MFEIEIYSLPEDPNPWGAPPKGAWPRQTRGKRHDPAPN
jgi:hypothetical protein